ncbi:MAG: DeoR family transcriptional regulator [Bacteroidetes bacterium]|nr:DeoR family transcriptional regulator [Bacteroidota bacterium]
MSAKRDQYVAFMDPTKRIERDPVIIPRQKSALRLVYRKGEITSRDYAGHCKVSETTARRDLQELILAGWLRREGAGRASRYLPGLLLNQGGGEQRVPNSEGDGDGCFNCG